jgi:hypothetical protein
MTSSSVPMRLINTFTYQIHLHQQPPEYAILSHKWEEPGDQELKLQDWVDGVKEAQKTAGSADPRCLDDPHCWPEMMRRKRSFLKIWGACKAARDFWDPNQEVAEPRVKSGTKKPTATPLGWLWADTICIDQRDAVEVDRSINSMFQWYEMSSACLVYLNDVPAESREKMWESGSLFRQSRWFRRGWTLQELIAPEKAVFYSREWVRLGHKHGEAQLIQQITSVPSLFSQWPAWEGRGDLHSRLSQAGVGARLSWLGRRETAFLGDMAYCALGIFQHQMSTQVDPTYKTTLGPFRDLLRALFERESDESILLWTSPTRPYYRVEPEVPPDQRWPTMMPGQPEEHQLRFHATSPLLEDPRAWAGSHDAYRMPSPGPRMELTDVGINIQLDLIPTLDPQLVFAHFPAGQLIFYPRPSSFWVPLVLVQGGPIVPFQRGLSPATFRRLTFPCETVPVCASMFGMAPRDVSSTLRENVVLRHATLLTDGPPAPPSSTVPHPFQFTIPGIPFHSQVAVLPAFPNGMGHFRLVGRFPYATDGILLHLDAALESQNFISHGCLHFQGPATPPSSAPANVVVYFAARSNFTTPRHKMSSPSETGGLTGWMCRVLANVDDTSSAGLEALMKKLRMDVYKTYNRHKTTLNWEKGAKAALGQGAEVYAGISDTYTEGKRAIYMRPGNGVYQLQDYEPHYTFLASILFPSRI